MGAHTQNIFRQNPKPVREDTIEMPPETREMHKYITFCFDIMYMNEITSVNSIETTIKKRVTEPLSNMYAEKLYQYLDVCVWVYNHAGIFFYRNTM